jgi:hypothetical protein
MTRITAFESSSNARRAAAATAGAVLRPAGSKTILGVWAAPKLLGDNEPVFRISNNDRTDISVGVCHASRGCLEHGLRPHEREELLRVRLSGKRPEAASRASR